MQLVHRSVIPFGVNIIAPDEVLEDYAIFFRNLVILACLRYTFLIDLTIVGFSASDFRIIGYLSSIIWNQPLVANFFGYVKPTQRLNSRDILSLICCPRHLRENVKQEIEREGITA